MKTTSKLELLEFAVMRNLGRVGDITLTLLVAEYIAATKKDKRAALKAAREDRINGQTQNKTNS